MEIDKKRMSLNTTQQIYEQIQRSDNILITFKRSFSIDSVASALALSKVLSKMGKKNGIVCDNFAMPKKLSFLNAGENIASELDDLRKFVISLDVSRTKLKEMSYDLKGDRLNIFLTPKLGTFSKKDISTASSRFKYDLIFILDTPDPELLGKIYEKNQEFFYETPIINLDHSPSNEYFGQINAISLSATSVSEMLFNIFNNFGSEFMDKDINTMLLAGMISKTKSFRSPHVTPSALSIAGRLVASEAQREEIIKNLYQTISISALKLWGKALSRLKSSEDGKIVWTRVTREDFSQCETGEGELDGIIDELISNTPGAKISFIFYESGPGRTALLAHAENELDAFNMLAKYRPEGARGCLKIELNDKTPEEAEKEMIAYASSKLKKYEQ